MTDYRLSRDQELAVVAEATYGTSAGDPVAGDFFSHESFDVVPVRGTKKRDNTRDYQKASVTEFHTGRGSTTYTIGGPVIPSGNASTPTAPDMHVLYEGILGTSHTATAHTTTTSGSTGTTLELTAGGGAASGIAVGDIIVVDVSTAVGLEARLVTAISTDTVTVNAAFTSDPATGRDVYVGTTYQLSESALNSFQLWRFHGNALRKVIPGSIANELELSVAFGDDVPTLMQSIKGAGQPQAAQTVSKPTATTAGQILTPDVGWLWIDGTKLPIFGATLNINNGLELRQNEGTSLSPTGVKRTGNNSRYMIEQTIDAPLNSDYDTIEAGGDSRTALEVVAQMGNDVGSIVVWVTPDWRPETPEKDQDGERALGLSGPCIGTSGDDEVYLGFI